MINKTEITGIGLPAGELNVSGRNVALPLEESGPGAPVDQALPLDDQAFGEGDMMRRAAIQYYPLHVKEETPQPPSAPWDSFCEAIMMDRGFINYFGESPNFLTMTESDKLTAVQNITCEGIDVGPFEKQVQCELGELVSIQNDWDIDRLKGEVPTLSKLTEVFRKPAEDENIPWEYLKDGCYARAHLTCGELLKNDINAAKIYVMISDAGSSPLFMFPKNFLKAENKYMKGEWWYHVAALSFAKDEKTGKTEGYVLDASVNPKEPVKASQWIKSFWPGGFHITFDVTQADIFNPPEHSFTDYEPHQFCQKDFDKFSKFSKQACQNYCKVLNKIKKEYYEAHPGEKPETAAEEGKVHG